MVFGAILFWTPDVILHAIAGNKFSRNHVLILTYILPLTVLAGLLVVGRMRNIETGKLIAPFGLLGIWFFGGVAMAASATFSGGGFATPEGWKGVALGAVPPFTLMMATYDGSLFALLLTTLCLLTVWLVGAVRPKLMLHVGVISVLAVLVILITGISQVAVASVARRLGEQVPPVSATQKEGEAKLEDIAYALKGAYHEGSPNHPPYLPHIPGLPAVTALTNLQPLFAKAQSAFLQQQAAVLQRSSSYCYCNLKPEIWSELYKHRSAEQRSFLGALTFGQTSYAELKRFGEYPVVWTSRPDASNQVIVITISLTSDIFRPCALSSEDLDKVLDDMQSLIRREMPGESLSLTNLH